MTVIADVPVTVDDIYTVVENSVLTTDAASGVLANDSDPDGLTLIVDSVSDPAHGEVTMNARRILRIPARHGLRRH